MSNYLGLAAMLGGFDYGNQMPTASEWDQLQRNLSGYRRRSPAEIAEAQRLARVKAKVRSKNKASRKARQRTK